jgi:hypothetical protein
MTITNVYYNADTGVILSYQEGESLTSAHETPSGCKRVGYAGRVQLTDEKSHRVNVKVDLETKQLVPLLKHRIIDEEDSVKLLEEKLDKATKDLETSRAEGHPSEMLKYLAMQITDLTIRLDAAKAKLGKTEVSDVQ